MLKINLEKTSFKPGNTISGDIVWSNERPETENIEARLIWYTEGKGDQDVEVVDSISFELTGNSTQNGQGRFEFVAPHRPSSFSGKLISLMWAIEAIVYPGKNGERTDIVVSRTGREIVLDRSYEQDVKKVIRFGN